MKNCRVLLIRRIIYSIICWRNLLFLFVICWSRGLLSAVAFLAAVSIAVQYRSNSAGYWLRPVGHPPARRPAIAGRNGRSVAIAGTATEWSALQIRTEMDPYCRLGQIFTTPHDQPINNC